LADLLGRQASEAQTLMAGWIAFPKSRDEVLPTVIAWEEETYNLITASLGQGEGHLFRVGHTGERPASRAS
jgi:hypothetical protein